VSGGFLLGGLALLVAGVAGMVVLEARAARSRAFHRRELALHRQQLRITLARTEQLVARAEAAVRDDRDDEADGGAPSRCACPGCAHLAIALALREHTAPWRVPILVGDVPRQAGFALRWGNA